MHQRALCIQCMENFNYEGCAMNRERDTNYDVASRGQTWHKSLLNPALQIVFMHADIEQKCGHHRQVLDQRVENGRLFHEKLSLHRKFTQAREKRPRIFARLAQFVRINI